MTKTLKESIILLLVIDYTKKGVLSPTLTLKRLGNCKKNRVFIFFNHDL